MRRNRTIIQSLIGATVIAGGMVALTPAAQAIGIPVACGEDALVAAVNLANSTAAADTLTLASGCTYNMTSSHGSPANGQEALPVITTRIEMIGPATITRASGQLFRIAEVSRTGKLTLTTGVALTNGSGIYNGVRGTLTTTGVSGSPMDITGNTATLNRGGGIAAVRSTATTLTQTAVTTNQAGMTAGGRSACWVRRPS